MKKTVLTAKELMNWFETNGWERDEKEEELTYTKGNTYVVIREKAGFFTYIDLSTGFSMFDRIRNMSIAEDGAIEFKSGAFLMSNTEIDFLKYFYRSDIYAV